MDLLVNFSKITIVIKISKYREIGHTFLVLNKLFARVSIIISIWSIFAINKQINYNLILQYLHLGYIQGRI